MAEYARINGAYALHPEIENINYTGFIDTCRRENIRLRVWNVNEATDINRMVKM